MRAKFDRELAALGLPSTPPADLRSITEADLAPLPEPARRYLRFMGVVGAPRDWAFRLAYTGRFRRTPHEKWMNCEAWQYNRRDPIARIFHIRIRFGGLVPVLGRDTYVEGRGRMLVRLMDLVTVADGQSGEFDIGELVTYLNDGILIAPGMLLGPECRWSPVDASSFDVSLTDRERTVTGRVSIAPTGAPVDFSTTDRFYAEPPDYKQLVRTRWTTPIDGWQTVRGRQLVTRAQAVWQTEAGPFAYGDFTPVASSLTLNLPPGARS